LERQEVSTNARGALVGIDLGTTYSLVAQVVEGTPRVLPNSVSEKLTPSAVHVAEDGSVLVGAAARAKASTDPERTALAFKRDMGTTREYQLGTRSFRPEELAALVLGELKRDAEAYLGERIREAVVTVPAYFGELQRRATQEACELAGLHVERIINEADRCGARLRPRAPTRSLPSSRGSIASVWATPLPPFASRSKAKTPRTSSTLATL
jgi:molecular chaperone HscC